MVRWSKLEFIFQRTPFVWHNLFAWIYFFSGDIFTVSSMDFSLGGGVYDKNLFKQYHLFPVTPLPKTFETSFFYYRNIVWLCKYCTWPNCYCTNTFPNDAWNVIFMACLFCTSTRKSVVHSQHLMLFSCTLSCFINTGNTNMLIKNCNLVKVLDRVTIILVILY